MVNPIAATDKDEGINQEFIFSLTGEGCSLFRIDPRNARVFFEGSKEESLNREEGAIYDLQVVAEDGGKALIFISLNLSRIFIRFDVDFAVV